MRLLVKSLGFLFVCFLGGYLSAPPYRERVFCVVVIALVLFVVVLFVGFLVVAQCVFLP